MNRAVFLFPGQGSQEPGLGRALVEAFPEAASLFERAGAILGEDFVETLSHADAEQLRETRFAQPAVFIMSMAAAEALGSLGIKPCSVAGHSLGEYSALVAAGVFSFEDGLRVVRERAKLMAECAARTKGGMVAILGIGYTDVKALVAQTAQTCPVEIANINCPDQTVVTGKEECVEKFAALALKKGARKAVRLKVSGAFHSAQMSSASEKLADTVDRYRFSSPRVPFISNVTADFVREPTRIKQLLVEQIRRPVRWEESMRRFVDCGYRLFVEVGPGRVLKGLMKRINPEVRVLSSGHPEAVRESAAEILKSGAQYTAPSL